MRSHLKSYFSVTKREWNGMVLLLVILLLVLTIPYIYQQFHEDKVIDFKDFDKEATLLKYAKATTSGGIATNAPLSDEKIANPQLFVFNPNNLPEQQWKQLGLSERQISILKHYEAKGGHFNRKEDLQKIYSITPEDYKRLEPYINIPDAGYISNKIAPGEVVDINKADSAGLTRIRGIGPFFAQRIVEYRQRLGGFLYKEQLKEVYGIDTTKYAGIKNQVTLSPGHITKVKINDVDFEGLRKFPYFSNKQTNAVIQYRQQHGNYRSIADMRNIVILDDVILRKIEPYISFK